MTKSAKKKEEERVYFDTKYGPLTIHQNGSAVKELAASPVPEGKGKDGSTHVIETMRLSLHLERFQGIEPFLEDIKCVINFPAADCSMKHDAPCQMRVGFTHGSAVVSTEPIYLTLSKPEDTVMEIEFFLKEESVTKLTIPVKMQHRN